MMDVVFILGPFCIFIIGVIVILYLNSLKQNASRTETLRNPPKRDTHGPEKSSAKTKAPQQHSTAAKHQAAASPKEEKKKDNTSGHPPPKRQEKKTIQPPLAQERVSIPLITERPPQLALESTLAINSTTVPTAPASAPSSTEKSKKKKKNKNPAKSTATTVPEATPSQDITDDDYAFAISLDRRSRKNRQAELLNAAADSNTPNKAKKSKDEKDWDKISSSGTQFKKFKDRIAKLEEEAQQMRGIILENKKLMENYKKSNAKLMADNRELKTDRKSVV